MNFKEYITESKLPKPAPAKILPPKPRALYYAVIALVRSTFPNGFALTDRLASSSFSKQIDNLLHTYNLKGIDSIDDVMYRLRDLKWASLERATPHSFKWVINPLVKVPPDTLENHFVDLL
jgi:hypothetical protein